MAKARQQPRTCAYPGCENEPSPGEAGAGAEPAYCGRPDPVSGTPHTALTAFRRRQELAQRGGEAAEPEDLRRSWIALWGRRRRRRQQAEAHAEEARSAALEADAQLAEALAARAVAEQTAVAAREAAQVQVTTIQQERDQAVNAARGRADDAESRTRAAELAAARVQQAAQSARAERDRLDRQMAQLQKDAYRQAELRATFGTQLAAVEDARAEFQARAERAEAELQRVRADREQTAGPAAPRPPKGAAGGRGRPSRTRPDPGTQSSRRDRKDSESNLNLLGVGRIRQAVLGGCSPSGTRFHQRQATGAAAAGAAELGRVRGAAASALSANDTL